jgi:hypothetical protein
MEEKLVLSFTTKFQSVGASTKSFTESPNEPALFVEHNDRLATHARLVNGMTNINVSLLILAQAVCVSPNKACRSHKPIVHALVGVGAGTYNWPSSARLVGGLKEERRWQSGSHRRS